MFRRACGAVLTMGLGVAVATGAEADLKALVKSLSQGATPKVRARAAAAIEKLGPEGKPAARALCRALFDPAPAVREAADLALDRVCPELHTPVAALLRRRVGDSHRRALGAIARRKRDGNPATPVVVAVLLVSLEEQRMLRVKEARIEAAARMRRQQAAAPDDDILALLQGIVNRMLEDHHQEVDANERQGVREREEGLAEAIRAALHTLAAVAPDETLAARAVAQALGSADVAVRTEAVAALAELDRSNAAQRGRVVGFLTAALRDPAPEVRLAAIRALAGFGAHAARAVPTLKKVKARDPSAVVRRAAEEALAQVAGP